MKTAEQKRRMNRITGFFRKIFGAKNPRRRDDCPKWVKKEAIARAKQKRRNAEQRLIGSAYIPDEEFSKRLRDIQAAKDRKNRR